MATVGEPSPATQPAGWPDCLATTRKSRQERFPGGSKLFMGSKLRPASRKHSPNPSIPPPWFPSSALVPKLRLGNRRLPANRPESRGSQAGAWEPGEQPGESALTSRANVYSVPSFGCAGCAIGVESPIAASPRSTRLRKQCQSPPWVVLSPVADGGRSFPVQGSLQRVRDRYIRRSHVRWSNRLSRIIHKNRNTGFQPVAGEDSQDACPATPL